MPSVNVGGRAEAGVGVLGDCRRQSDSIAGVCSLCLESPQSPHAGFQHPGKLLVDLQLPRLTAHPESDDTRPLGDSDCRLDTCQIPVGKPSTLIPASPVSNCSQAGLSNTGSPALCQEIGTGVRDSKGLGELVC